MKASIRISLGKICRDNGAIVKYDASLFYIHMATWGYQQFNNIAVHSL